MEWEEHEDHWSARDGELKLYLEELDDGWLVELSQDSKVLNEEEFGSIVEASRRAREIREGEWEVWVKPDIEDCDHEVREWTDEHYGTDYIDEIYKCPDCGAHIRDIYALHKTRVEDEDGNVIEEHPV